MGQHHDQQQQQQQGGAMTSGVVDSGDNVFFEYKGKDGNVHGPYGASQMRQWAQQGYFDGEQAVMMRRVPSSVAEGGVSTTVNDIYHI